MISFVILTYNNLRSATEPMCTSLFNISSLADVEIIFIDNRSTDGTVDFLKDLQARHSKVRLILNDVNVGFSKGMNQGLAAAKGDVIFLMNNDILFTPGWLETALAVIQRPEIGLVSPLINQPGDGLTADNYLQKYTALRSKQDKDFEYRCFIPFCCVGFRRQVFEKIGFLDEAFTPAYYEDNDYCLRSLYAGYKNAIALKSFVFHNHCQTTGQMADRKALLARNRQIYHQKHLLGEYIDHLIEENKKWRKKSISYRLKKLLVAALTAFIVDAAKKKQKRKRLEFLWGLD